MSIEEIRAALARLAELTDAELADLAAALRSYADGIDLANLTDDQVTELEELAAGQTAVQAAIAERETAATARADRAAAAIAALAPTPDPENDDPENEGDDPDADPETPEDATDPVPEPQPEAVAAGAARRPTGRQLARGAGRNAAPPAPVVPAAPQGVLVAAASLPGFATGQAVTSLPELAEGIIRRVTSTRYRSGTDDDPTPVASIRYAWPTERQLVRDNPAQNTARVNQIISRPALAAAGGLCAPLENIYDVPVIGVQARPVRDALAGFQAERGGIQYRVPPSLAALAGASSLWTMQNDIDAATAGGVDPVKPCLDVVCPSLQTGTVYAVPMCLTFRNVAARFDPEMVASNIEFAMIAHARLAENTLLAGITALSKTLTWPKALGATRDILALIDHLTAYHRSVYRLDIGAPQLRMAMPAWVHDMILTDMVRATHTADPEFLAIAEAAIAGWFGRRGITPVWHLDGTAAEVAGGGAPAVAAQFYSVVAANAAIPEFPDTVSINIWTEGDMLFLDGGQLDIGVVRDATLVQTNAYKQFSETFEGVVHRGLTDAYRVVATLSPNGTSAAPVDTSALED